MYFVTRPRVRFTHDAYIGCLSCAHFLLFNEIHILCSFPNYVLFKTFCRLWCSLLLLFPTHQQTVHVYKREQWQLPLLFVKELSAEHVLSWEANPLLYIAPIYLCIFVNLSIEDGCTDGDVRLVGENENQGRVQFCHGNVWGEICASNTWKESDASVACKQLGYAGGTVSKPNGVSMSRPTILEDLQCTGTEAQLSDCPNPDVHVYPCNEDTFAGASCFQGEATTSIS